jgi:hypothetical protein
LAYLAQYLVRDGRALLSYILWPEELYKLSVNCKKYEVPDTTTTKSIILGEEFRKNAEEHESSPSLPSPVAASGEGGTSPSSFP